MVLLEPLQLAVDVDTLYTSSVKALSYKAPQARANIESPLNREGGEVHLIAKYSNISHMVYGKTMQLGGCRCNWVSDLYLLCMVVADYSVLL